MEGVKSNVHYALCTHTNHQHQMETALHAPPLKKRYSIKYLENNDINNHKKALELFTKLLVQ
jgi:hypothetical protein